MLAIDRQKERNTEFLERRDYEKPDFSVLELSIVTLGGTVGTGDSGNNNEATFDGAAVSNPDETHDDWGYDY